VIVDDLIEWLRDLQAAADPPVCLSGEQFDVGDLADDDVVDEETLIEMALAELDE
jgi:hypothetical protein